MKNHLTTLLIPAIILIFGCGKNDEPIPLPDLVQESGNISFEFKNMMGDKVLVINNEEYLLNGTDTVSISGLKYMISNIELYKDGVLKFKENGSYHLIDESISTTKIFTLADIPLGEYDEVKISIGVDSSSNNGTTAGGDLGTGSGLFWINWGSYIFFRIDGIYIDVNHFQLSNHIGGDNVYAKYELNDLPSNIQIADNKLTPVIIKMNIDELYTNPTKISLGDSSNRVVAHKGDKMDLFGTNMKSGILTISSIGDPE